MTKELLSAWNVDFEPVNVEGNLAALQEMVQLGAPLVPAVAYQGKIVHGWNPAAVAQLVGVPYSDTPELSPQALRQRLNRILADAREALERTPVALLETMGKGRNRTLRNLGYHLFRVAASYVDSLEGDGLQEAWLQEEAPDSMRTGADLSQFGAGVQERLERWFGQAPSAVFGETVYTYYGEQTAHSLLDRTTWHAGQHLRQIHDLLEQHAVLTPGSLPAALFDKLPMPRAVW